MADADVPITAGSGTKIDTRTVGAGTDEHRQVVVLGDPTTAANVAIVDSSGRILSVVEGNVAHDAVDSGNPIKIGGYAAEAPLATPLPVANGDRANLWLGINGQVQASFVAQDGAALDDGGGILVSPAQVFDVEPNGSAVRDSSITPYLFATGSRASTASPAAVSADGDLVDFWLTRNGATVVDGGVAHDAVDSGNPVKIGGYASATAPADVSANADRVNAWYLRNGAQATVVTAAGALIGGDVTNGLDVDVTRGSMPHNVGITALSIAAAFTTTQTSTNLIAGTGGQRIYVTNITIATGGTTAGRVSIYYGTGAFTAGTSVTLFDGEFAPSATACPGAVLSFTVPVGGASATGDNLRITTSAAMTVYVTGQAYKA